MCGEYYFAPKLKTEYVFSFELKKNEVYLKRKLQNIQNYIEIQTNVETITFLH